MKRVLFFVVLVLPLIGSVSLAVDFNGDGVPDIGVFRPASGLWAVRGVTRAYFGSSGDTPVPADYDQDGRDDIAVFRPASGLWAVRGLTRTYFGQDTDQPLIGGGGGLRVIAAGQVDEDGTLQIGTSNISSTWTGTRYEITLAGTSFIYYNYLVVVTPIAGFNDCRTATTTSSSGKLVIYIYDCKNDTNVQDNFSFVIYKP